MAASRKPYDKPLTDADYRALAELRHPLRQFWSFSEDTAHRAGWVPRHAHATVGDLAERLGIKSHSAGGPVNRLTAARLVRRVPDRADRRRVYLTLTPAAERRLGSSENLRRWREPFGLNFIQWAVTERDGRPSRRFQ